MTRDQFLTALKDAPDAYLAEAAALLDTEPAPAASRRPLRRVLIAAAVAAALLLAAFTVAMAASEGFRENVRRVFRIRTQERVVSPAEPPDADVPVTDKVFTLQKHLTLDGAEVRYYSVEGNIVQVFRSNGLVYRLTDGGETDGVFYRLSADKLPERLETQYGTVTLEYQGMQGTVAYDWLKCGDGWAVHQGRIESTAEEPFFGEVMIAAQPDREDVWLVSGRMTPQGTVTMYPLLLDVPTGTLSDPLDGLVPKDRSFVAWEFSRDGQFALARDVDGHAWVYDLAASAETDLNTMVEAAYLDCRMLSDGQVACVGYDGNAAHAVRYDPADGSLHELIQTTEDERLTLDGPIYANSGYVDYAQLTDASGAVSLLDLHDGARIALDGIVGGQSFVVCQSPSAEKLLLAIYAPGSCRVERLGVLDLKTNTYVELAREPGAAVEEYDMVWLDDDSFVIRTEPIDGRTGVHIYTLRAPE